jgi:hypothetical protein
MALVVTRGRPSIDSDAGIFLSVAARLLAGDRLYADVYDNKSSTRMRLRLQQGAGRLHSLSMCFG